MNMSDTLSNKKQLKPPRKQTAQHGFATPFGTYFKMLDKVDKGKRYRTEFGSILILSLLEELGELARAYLAEHGRKPSNVAAQHDENTEQELGDILVTILRYARIKHINLHDRILYSIKKIEQRRQSPKL